MSKIKFNSPDFYYIALAIEHIQSIFECPICDHQADNRNCIIDHIINQHTNEQIKEICSE